MKTRFTAQLLFAGLFSLMFTANSCAKADHSTDLPNEQQAVGKWSINRIQLKIFVNGVFVQDTILKQTPQPQNFVQFGSNGEFEYRFNSNRSDIGTYEFTSPGKIITNSNPKTYSWTVLTLTNNLFTVVSKEPDPAFPGALVERYETFIP
ncbi:MAG: hypothetical protein IPL84_01035 [Chitinophagaceae bacterium]|nr:hypothetical protein [Chitinophagaceae bacterium]